MNILSRSKRVIFFYAFIVGWVVINVMLFFYLALNWKSQFSHLMIIPYIPLMGALYFSLDLFKKRKMVFLAFTLVFFASQIVPILILIQAMLGFVSRSEVVGFAFAYLFFRQSLFQLFLISVFFIYERMAKNAQRLRKILIPLVITVGAYVLYSLIRWIQFLGFEEGL